MRKTWLFVAILFLAVVCGNPLSAAAQGDYGINATVRATDNLLPTTIAGADSVPKLIGRGIAVILGLLGIVFFLIIFYAGIRWMTARGNSEKVDEAKNAIEAAVIGLIIVLASYAISNFVFESLTKDPGVAGPGSKAVCERIVSETKCTETKCVWFSEKDNPLGGTCTSVK